MKRLMLFVLVLALICVVPGALFGATIRVPDDEPTIQDGINAANYLDIVLVADNTWTGAGNKNLDFGGKAITVMSENGPEHCIIDCEHGGRGFYFHSGEGINSVVSGFTITNGSANEGGGIYCNNSSPTITNSTITGNTAIGEGSGGGICCYYYANPTITNNTITKNMGGSGAGIYLDGSSDATVSANTITENTATDNEDSDGAGICIVSSNPIIADNIITGNTGDTGGGGGIYCDDGSSPIITNNIMTGNANDAGGGIYCGSGASPTITNNTIVFNTAGPWLGGGICCEDCSLTVTNCILWGNTPDEICVYTGTATVTYSDIQGGYSGEGNINADPLFVGGDNYHLTNSSPCIDAGRNDAVELPTDFEGDPRIIDGDNDGTATVDMGADEFGPPVPDIKANGSDGPVDIAPGDSLSITIWLDPGMYHGYPADWWVLADAPFGWYYYDAATKQWLPGFHVSYQGALFALTPPVEVLNTSGLPVGTYDFYFGIDGWRNGRLDYPYLYYDSVRVNITP